MKQISIIFGPPSAMKNVSTVSQLCALEVSFKMPNSVEKQVGISVRT